MLAAASLLLAVPAQAGLSRGDVAPTVVLADAEGHPVGLEAFRGRVVILDFTASWCVACRTALPELEKLGRRWADRGVLVVTVVLDADRPDADRFLAAVVPGHAMTVLYDPPNRASAESVAFDGGSDDRIACMRARSVVSPARMRTSAARTPRSRASRPPRRTSW